MKEMLCQLKKVLRLQQNKKSVRKNTVSHFYKICSFILLSRKYNYVSTSKAQRETKYIIHNIS